MAQVPCPRCASWKLYEHAVCQLCAGVRQVPGAMAVEYAMSLRRSPFAPGIRCLELRKLYRLPNLPALSESLVRLADRWPSTVAVLYDARRSQR